MLVYLHGFASGPSSFKAQLFKRRLAERGIELAVPALDEGDFEHLTLSRQARLLETTCRGSRGPLVLIGSSMGGYLAALHAAIHPVAALVLMAPAFDFEARLRERLGEQGCERWRALGTTQVFHVAEKRERGLGYELLSDAGRHPAYPQVGAPTLVFHGLRDEVVPLERVERWCSRAPRARLERVEAGHELVEVAEEIFEKSRTFLASLPEVVAAWPSLGR